MFYVYFKYFPSNTLRVIHCITYLHTVILNKFYIHTGSCFPLEHTLRALVGFFSVVAVFCKTRSFNFPDDLFGASLLWALLDIMGEVPGCVLHSAESVVIHFLTISSRKCISLFLYHSYFCTRYWSAQSTPFVSVVIHYTRRFCAGVCAGRGLVHGGCYMHWPFTSPGEENGIFLQKRHFSSLKALSLSSSGSPRLSLIAPDQCVVLQYSPAADTPL